MKKKVGIGIIGMGLRGTFCIGAAARIIFARNKSSLDIVTDHGNKQKVIDCTKEETTGRTTAPTPS